MEKLAVDVESLEMQIVIRFNPATAEFSLKGCDENPIVALGALDYALARVRRFLTQGDLAREFHDASRIAIPGGPLS